MTTECDKQVIVGNSIGILGNDGGSCSIEAGQQVKSQGSISFSVAIDHFRVT